MAVHDSTTSGNDAFKTMDLALRVGEMLLSSGAGAADVSAQMSNVAYACGLRGYTADVMFTELAISHQPEPDKPALLQIRQVRYRGIDYGDLAAVDRLVRALVEGDLDRDEALARLKRITSSGHGRARWSVTLALGLMGGAVGLVLGGDGAVVLSAMVAAIGIDLIQRRMTRARMPLFYQQVAGGLFATLLSVAVVASGVEVSPSRVITATIIILLAGVSFLGAIQDALTGFPLTAGARILEAFIATAGVVAGVSGGLTVARLLGVDLGEIDPGLTTLADLPRVVVGAAITAAAWAYTAYTPHRALAPIAVLGGVATGLYFLAYRQGVGIAWASALAALLIGLLAFSVAARVKVPALVVVTTCIVPMLPGLSIYRGLTLLGQRGSDGLLSMFTAASIAIALSSGAILGQYVAQPLRREARRLESKLAGPRLVGPLTVRSARQHHRSHPASHHRAHLGRNQPPPLDVRTPRDGRRRPPSP